MLALRLPAACELPSEVANGSMRCVCVCRLLQITSNLKNTVTGIKAIVGKKFHSDEIQTEQGLVAFNMVDTAGNVGIPVQYNDEQITLTPERAMAMLMKCLQGIAEEDQKSPVTDVVISVSSTRSVARQQLVVVACFFFRQ